MDFVETVVDRIGEIMQPIRSGAISRDPMRGDLYDLVAAGGSSRRSDDQVTLFKNGGGAHLDLMIASYVVEALKSLKIKYRSRHLPDRRADVRLGPPDRVRRPIGSRCRARSWPTAKAARRRVRCMSTAWAVPLAPVTKNWRRGRRAARGRR
ncbi:hypothetical protein [Paracoccus sp. FO-3]|uniref:hypothetical protein n=1 Tax=Paracoccus sp. FO-3 TaxID=1335059 RepID=UPI002106F1A1|nr:hypothetical protein [Paracoccus sp. FO-3]